MCAPMEWNKGEGRIGKRGGLASNVPNTMGDQLLDLGLTLKGQVRKELINRLRNLHLGCPEVSSRPCFSRGYS
jgi:hypothetical protein